ncbi:OmpA family protein [Gallaecimonas sp. GXIMD4217]|uniref:OmpA family protein n=1 Tax=Gallaecimonas sp. GXIMD4217 TaxID=3131927 RepID=UPI00311B13F6
MNKVSAFRFSVVAALVTLSLNAQADVTKEDLAGRVYVGGHVNMMDLDSDRMAKSHEMAQDFKTFAPGVELGYRISNDWEVRGYYDYVQADLKNHSSSAYGESFGADVIYNFTNNFYGLVGINRTNVEQMHDSFARLGAGYRTFFNDNLAFRAEVAAQQDDSDFTDYVAGIGLQYFFGGKPAPAPVKAPEPKPEPVVMDSDNDGVPDDKDACPGTPAQYQVDARGCTKYDTETVTEKLLVNFDNNSALVKPQYFGEIQRIAKFMKAFPKLDVVIEGHTSAPGKASYNLTLSERRAQAVGEVLASEFGIDRARIKTVGYGETRPVMAGSSKEANAANRRIEAKLSATRKVEVTK